MGKRPPQLWRFTGMLEEASRHVDQFVSPSCFTARMHADRGFPRKVDHLPYFIDRADLDWMDPGPRPQERPYFLFVGRLEAIKGLQTLIPLWNNVRDFDLLVAGTGAHGDALIRMAAGNPHIRFLGPRSQAELGTLYVHAAAVLVPSITYETFGIVIIEAFARKTPVIVRDLGALPEVVRASGGGFVYRTDDELLASIRRIGTDPSLRRGLGEKGYEAFIRYWTREAHLKLYFEFLERASEQRVGRVPWRGNGIAHRTDMLTNVTRTAQATAANGESTAPATQECRHTEAAI